MRFSPSGAYADNACNLPAPRTAVSRVKEHSLANPRLRPGGMLPQWWWWVGGGGMWLQTMGPAFGPLGSTPPRARAGATGAAEGAAKGPPRRSRSASPEGRRRKVGRLSDDLAVPEIRNEAAQFLMDDVCARSIRSVVEVIMIALHPAPLPLRWRGPAARSLADVSGQRGQTLHERCDGWYAR